MVQDVLGPLDRLPGLQVGQRREARMINPFNGKVDSVRAAGRAPDDDRLGRESRVDIRGRAEDVPPDDEDLGPNRRRDLAAGGAVPVRSSDAGASAGRRPGTRRDAAPAPSVSLPSRGPSS